jgi:hypothetical protein
MTTDNLEAERLRKQINAVEKKSASIANLRREVDVKVGKFARITRKDHRLRLQTVADRCGISLAKLWSLEHGQAHWTAEQVLQVIDAIKGGAKA